MLENLNRISNSGFIIAVISAIATLISSYFYFGTEQQETAKAIATLTVYFVLLAVFIYQRLNTAFKTDVNRNEGQKLNILLLYSEKENNTELINAIVGKHSNQFLNFVNFKVDIKDQNTFSNLESELKSTDGVYCFWNEEIKNRYESYISIIEKWLQKYEAKPFIIIANEDDVEDKIKSQYRVINSEGAENSLPILLSRSISRTKRFISDAKTWRLAFICSTLVLLSILGMYFISFGEDKSEKSIKIGIREVPHSQSKILFDKLSYLLAKSDINALPKMEIRNYLDKYIQLKQKQLSELLNDGSIEITLWRSDKEGANLNRVTSSSDPTNVLPLNSIAGCACVSNEKSDSYIVGWQAKDGDDVKHFWGLQNGLRQDFEANKNACKYLPKPNSRTSIISSAIKLVPSERYNIICIDSKFKDNMISDHNSNEIVKYFVAELANLTSIIPNEVFDETNTSKQNPKPKIKSR